MDFVAGCIGGAAGVLVGHPFDTVKVRLQVQNVNKPMYRGTIHCFQSIIRQESLFGLYKGIGSPMMGLTFINAIVFGVQGNAMRRLGQDTPTNQFLAGAAAGAIQCVICCPMELAKTRMQMQGTGEKKSSRKMYKNSIDCLVRIYRREGMWGINRGMVTTLLRETPAFGFYFLVYDVLTRQLGCEPEDRYMIPKLLFAGGMAGIASWLSTYPVDVIKSRLQADGVGGVHQYSGIADCVRQSVRKEGYMVFTRGLTSTLLRAFPVNAATFATVTLVLMYARGPVQGVEDCETAPKAASRHSQGQAQAQTQTSGL
ncbi:mitochondrial basic amino acids transporter-like isoform X2 [Corythoichthys intestinalis]|uniref:mitochondrial basic amino acids transporter-like isoform X2 n=1 Tax=Corythoichthys intestinalis TaxID=161448 RepID=UPI0025A5BD2B|nr:mitochondrial basic amino acids transporter-like isoform X2 [Corythoichthys intestinalis]XP_061806931.1 mitochondrial basic amino acids transporter-like [Nerophis lumbriciformis]